MRNCRAASPENKVGGYLWRGELKLYDNERLIGHYLARDPNVRFKGSLYFLLNRSGNFLFGKWIGCNYDSGLISGWGVIAREREFALQNLRELVAATKDPVNFEQMMKGGEE